VSEKLIDIRAACHPVRLLADCEAHLLLPQPLVTPFSMLPEDVRASLADKETLDFGLTVAREGFRFHDKCARLPNSLVVAYVLAIATSGGAREVLLAGFDGYPADDPRNGEMEELLASYLEHPEHLPLRSITPTRYHVPVTSLYGLVD
jgi:4-hydroxy 2-oxovalerate aldolase